MLHRPNTSYRVLSPSCLHFYLFLFLELTVPFVFRRETSVFYSLTFETVAATGKHDVHAGAGPALGDTFC